ncbi:MAG: S41 family peptidase [Oscillospiraceae bacterium]
MNRKVSVSVAMAITILAMAVTFAITWVLSMNTFDNTVSSVTQLQAQYSKLAEMDTYVRANFLGEIDDDALFDRVAAGYVIGLGDRYSVYYTEREYTELLAVQNGTLVGIGIEVVREADGFYRVARVYPDSPAERAGVKKGGSITQLNGEDTRNISSVSAFTSQLRGEQGTEVTLTCLYGVAEEERHTVRRINYTPPTVESQMLGDYCYIRIISFGDNTYTDFDYLVRQAQAAGARGLVFDLRGTNAGTYRQCYQMIDMLCPRGTVARRENRNGTTTVLATSDENEVALPMAVLVNEGTGGASELFAVNIRDLSGGQVVGTRTMGRGTLQSSPQRLSDGSAVSVTAALMLTGSGDSYNGVGVLPDVEAEPVDLDEGALLDPNAQTDSQIKRALEVVRAMVIAEGGEPGSIEITPAVPTQSSADSSAETTGNSETGAADASTADPSDASDDSDADDSADTGEDDSASAS